MKYIWALIIFAIQEVVGLVVFPIIYYYLGPQKKGTAWNLASILKGILERLVLYISLIYGYPQMLIAFGAMKLGTRLHEEKDSKISNTYFLVGNLLSMLLAMISSVVTKAVWSGQLN